MSDEIKDTNTETATLTPPAAPQSFKLTAAEVVAQLRGYYTQADLSQAQLQSNIEAANQKIDEWRRMHLMIAGQKQIVADLLNKIVDAPAAPTPDKQ